VNPRHAVGEIYVDQMADIMAGDSFADGSTTTGRTCIAARKYRMLVQWYGGRFEVDEDIERLISSVLRLNKHFKIHPEAFGSEI
jgi:ribosomal protein S15P/S13E